MIQNRRGAVIGDLESDPRWQVRPGQINTHRSALAVPLVTNEDSLGAMILLSPEPNAFDDDQLRLVAAAANQVAAAINNAELYRLIRDQAERLGGMLRSQQVEATRAAPSWKALPMASSWRMPTATSSCSMWPASTFWA